MFDAVVQVDLDVHVGQVMDLFFVFLDLEGLFLEFFLPFGRVLWPEKGPQAGSGSVPAFHEHSRSSCGQAGRSGSGACM